MEIPLDEILADLVVVLNTQGLLAFARAVQAARAALNEQDANEEPVPRRREHEEIQSVIEELSASDLFKKASEELPARRPPVPKARVDKEVVAKFAEANPAPAKKAQKPSPAPEPEPKPEPQKPVPAPTPASEPEPAQDEDEERKAIQEEPPARPVRSGNGLPQEVAKATKLRDIVRYLQSAGKTNDEVVAQIVEWKDSLPMLGKVANIEERVRRTIEMVELIGTV